MQYKFLFVLYFKIKSFSSFLFIVEFKEKFLYFFLSSNKFILSISLLYKLYLQSFLPKQLL